MSFFSQASLVMIPSGYKTSKVYSAVPTDGAGDLVFTRTADTATRVGPDGLIEKVRTNLILQSQALATTWALFEPSGGGTITRTNNYATAPDGTMTATRIVNTGSSPFQWVYQNFTHPNNTLSVWAKSTSGTNQTFRLFGSNGGLNSANFTATNTWQRFTFSVSTVTTLEPLGISADSSGNAYDILFWGFQFETGDIATDYIATTSAAVSVGPVANVPRLDYLGSTCGKLLLEPQRTNTITFSENVTSCLTSQIGTTVTANATASPDGYQSADLIAFTSGSYRLRGQTVAAATTYTMSVFYKNNTFSGSETVLFNMSDGVIGGLKITILPAQNAATFAGSAGAWTGVSGKVENYGNGWYRVSATGTSVNGGGGWYEIASSFTKSAYFWGFSLEIGAYATSYIPTYGAAVTRGADAASKTGISSLIGQTEGTLFVEMNINKRVDLGGSGPNGLEIKDASGSNVIMIGTAYGPSQLFSLSFRNAGTFTVLASTTNNAIGTYKLAAAYSSAGFVFYVNGVQIGTGATLPPVATFADMGLIQVFGSNNVQGELVSQTLLFKTRLTNAQLAELTTI